MGKLQYTSARETIAAQDTGYKTHSVVLPSGLNQFKVDKQGMRRFDILPYRLKVATSFAPVGMLHFERTYFVHRNVGLNRESWNCPYAMFGKRCPICEERGRRQAAGEDPKDLTDLRPQRRQLWLVVDHDQPRPEPQVWDFSYYSFGRVLAENLSLKASAGRDFYHFFHLDGGLTLHVGFGQKQVKTQPYYEAVSIDFVDRKRQFSEKLIDRLPCLDEMVIVPTYEDLLVAYEGPGSAAEAEDAPAPSLDVFHVDDDTDLVPPAGVPTTDTVASLFDTDTDQPEDTMGALEQGIDELWGEPAAEKPKRGRKSQE